MNEQIKDLIDTLHRADVKLDATQLAEALWLAEHIQLMEDKEEGEKQSLWDSLAKLLDFKFDWKNKKHKEFTTEVVESETIQSTQRIEEKKASLSLPNESDNAEGTHYISPPKKRDIFVTNQLIKSLYGLKQKRPSTKKGVLCEDETVEYIAKTGIVRPLFRGKKESAFELFLVIDCSASMEIWQESIEVFEKKLREHKIFNTITTLYLDASVEEAMLYHDKGKTQACSLARFQNPYQRALTFVLSDTVDTAWRNTTALSLIYAMQEKVPTVLINMLPYRMWRGTILGHTNITTLKANTPYAFNGNLKSNIDRKLVKLDEFYFSNNRVLKLPIVNLREQDFRAISMVIKGVANNQVSGLVATLDKMKPKESISDEDISPQEIFHDYLENTSEMAITLALYMSVVRRVNINIMQIVQKIMLEESTQTHLAEFFLGGLLNKSQEGEFYEFKDGVDTLFRKELGNARIYDTLYKVSDEIAKEIGSSLDFKALLNPHYQGNKDFDSEDKIFGFISPETLKQLGGKYAQIADEVTGVTMQEPDEEDGHEWQSPNIEVLTPPSKRFQMGSEDGDDDEKPLHQVTLNYDFEIAQTPVTVGEFRAFVEESGYVTEAEEGDGAGVWTGEKWEYKEDANWKNPYFEQTDEHPVVCVSWNDAQAYIKWLNEKTDETYRLPTEAEWEFSCRAGTETKWHFGDDESELEKYAWYRKNSFDLGKEHKNFGTNPVKGKLPNQWGLYDMHGNVWEWCEDDWAENYNETPVDGSANHSQKKERKSLRGGSWGNDASGTRSAVRYWSYPGFRDSSVGFRLLRTLP